MTRSHLPRIPPPLRLAVLKAGRMLRRHNVRGSHILVAVSGGPDSSLLVATLALLAPRVGFTLEACHVNHGLGPAAASMEEAARTVCERSGIPFHQRAVTVSDDTGLGVEGAARTVRHAALQEVMRACGATFLATGHTATDVAETFLQRILEGSGRGQGALPERDGAKLRPLLDLDRREVREAVTAAGIPAIHDPMNDDTDLLRGFLRREVWPLLEARFGAPDRTLARAAVMARADHDALETWARGSWTVDNGLSRALARTVPAAVVSRALRQMVEAAANGPVRTGAEAVRKTLDAAVQQGGPVRRFKAGPVWLVVGRTHVQANAELDNDRAPSEPGGGAWYGLTQTHGPSGPGKAG